MATYSDPAVARELMESSLGVGSKPDLSEAQLNTLFALAGTETGDWTSESLSAVVAMGWRWKAALVSNKYELGAGGASLKQNQWFDQCTKIANYYTTGEWAVGSTPGLMDSGALVDADEPFYFVSDFLTSGGSEWS